MKLTESVVRNFLVAKVFRENKERINSLDFATTGETLISSSDDDSIIIYDCQNGTYVFQFNLLVFPKSFLISAKNKNFFYQT